MRTCNVETSASVATNSHTYIHTNFLTYLVQAVCLNEASESRVRRCNAKKYRGSGCIGFVGGSVAHYNKGPVVNYTHPAVLISVHSTKSTAYSVENGQI
jgi:hypothetical protein